MDDESRPLAAFIISLAGAFLILVNGVLVLFLASVVYSTVSTSGVAGSDAAATLNGVGLLGAILGFILLILAVVLYRNTDLHVGLGVAILVLSLLSFFGGGGFILGLILGVIGGILAIIFDPGDDLNEMPEWHASTT